jgi:hypothetical protein
MSQGNTPRISVLELSAEEARRFFLKGESYCGFDLPSYFSFDTLLAKVSKQLSGKRLSDMQENPRDYDDLHWISIILPPIILPLPFNRILCNMSADAR